MHIAIKFCCSNAICRLPGEFTLLRHKPKRENDSKFISLALKLKFNYLLRNSLKEQKKKYLEHEEAYAKVICGWNLLLCDMIYKCVHTERPEIKIFPALTLLLLSFLHARRAFTVPLNKKKGTNFFNPPAMRCRDISRRKLD